MVSMVVVATATLYSVHRNYAEGQAESIAAFVLAVAREPVLAEGNGSGGTEWHAFLRREMEVAALPQAQPAVYLLDETGLVIRHYPDHPAAEAKQVLDAISLAPDSDGTVQTIEPVPGEGGVWLAAVKQLEGGPMPGHAVALMPLETMMPALERFRLVRLAGAATMILVGWGVVYLMTRRFVEPIRSAVAAVRQIVAGNYDINLKDEQHQTKEIAELMEAFADMAKRLRQHESLRGQLLAGVTHELRTPITSISGLIQAVRDGVVTGEEAEKFLEAGLKQTDRLQKMVDDLLEFNRFATQEITVRLTDVYLPTLVKDAVQRWSFGQETAGTGLTVRIDADRTQDWRVQTDPERIEQVLVNLLNNARDEMPDGGEIRITLAADPDHVLVHVADTGPGIPVDQQLHLFEPYFRGERKKRRIHGLGLGLSFSLLIARSLGGELSLAASDATGSTFTLRLPRN